MKIRLSFGFWSFEEILGIIWLGKKTIRLTDPGNFHKVTGNTRFRAHEGDISDTGPFVPSDTEIQPKINVARH